MATEPAAAAPSPAASPMALRRLVAELLVLRASGHLSDVQRRYPRWELPNGELQRLLGEGVGGVILLGGSAAEVALRTRQLQAWARGPLLLCADVEEGVGQRFEGASWLVPPLTLGRLHGRDPRRALELAERYGRCTAREARALGLNWLLAPVCDVNNNPANPVINVRAWGEDPASVAALACAFLGGAQAEGVLCCAKHFPGHGDTASDSHLELPLLPHDRARLEAIELPPFRAAIAADVAAVMTAHLALPQLDPDRPATLSAPVLQGLLRDQLGFGGLVVTDALVMEAISRHYGAGEAAVLALEAGADLVLMPADADAAIAAVLGAVAEGRLSREQLEASARRRRDALARLQATPDAADAADGHRREPSGPADCVDLATTLAALPCPADRQLAEELVAAGLEVHGPQPPLPPPGPGCNLIRLDGAPGCPFLPAAAPALALPAERGYRRLLLEGSGSPLWSGDPRAPLRLELLGEGPVLLQLFRRGNPFSGGAGAGEPWAATLAQLLVADRLAGLAVYGSPYLWDELKPLLPPQLPAAYCPGQMPLAQQRLLEVLGWGLAPAAGGFTD